jgi:D-tyrosyl-tRNA(Tyr) deacylase
MRILIQRVSSATVSVDAEVVGSIGKGLLAFVGFKVGDDAEMLEYLAQKLINLRMFEDSEGKMNLSIGELGLECLIVSQFTLYGETKKGNRPSFIEAERPEIARMLYERFVDIVRGMLGSEKVAEGRFATMMQVELVNDGPVTLLLER